MKMPVALSGTQMALVGVSVPSAKTPFRGLALA